MTEYYMGVPSPATIISCVSVLLVLDTTVVALRFYARKKLKQLLYADDWLTVPSFILSLILAGNLLYGVSTEKLGYAINSLEDMTRGIPTRKHEYVTITVAPLALAFIKMSCLFLYRRLFVVDKTNFRDARNIFFAASICIIMLWGGGIFLPYLFICKTNWYLLWGPPWEAEGKCLDYKLLGMVYIYSDFVTDVLVILIPVPFVWQLRLKWQKKIAVTGVFLLGIFASIASLLRMLWIRWSTKVGFDPTLDEAIMTTFSMFWLTLEVQVGLLAACLPTLPTLFREQKFVSSLKTWWSASHAGSSSKDSLHTGTSVAFMTEHTSSKM